MRFRVERGREALRDLKRIHDFLFDSYMHFGDSPEEALDRADERLKAIGATMRALAARPRQGTLHPQLMPGLRSVTKDRAVFYFTIDEEKHVVRVLAVFFGGQDHRREMLKRMMGE